MCIIVGKSTLAKSITSILNFMHSCLVCHLMQWYEFRIRTLIQLHLLRFTELVILMINSYSHGVFFSILMSMNLLRTKILLKFAINLDLRAFFILKDNIIRIHFLVIIDLLVTILYLVLVFN